VQPVNGLLDPASYSGTSLAMARRISLTSERV
jgi:hypothetical protein